MPLLSREEQIVVRNTVRAWQAADREYGLYGTGSISREILALLAEWALPLPALIVDHRPSTEPWPVPFVRLSRLTAAACPPLLLGSNTHTAEMRRHLAAATGGAVEAVDFSHLRRAAEARREADRAAEDERLLQRLYAIATVHPQYAVYGLTSFTRRLLGLLRFHKLRAPVGIVAPGSRETHVDGVPVVAPGRRPDWSAMVLGAGPVWFEDLREQAARHLPADMPLLYLFDPELEHRYPFDPEQTVRVPFLANHHALLGLTRRCNLACRYCMHAGVSNRGLPELPLVEARRILDALKGHAVHVLLSGDIGEPLVYPHLEEVVAYARTCVPQVAFATNGVLLRPDRSRTLAEAGLTSISLSLDSTDRDLNYRLRGIDTEAVLANLEYFSKRTGLPVTIGAVLTRQAVPTLSELPALRLRIPTLEAIFLMPMTGITPESLHGADDLVLTDTAELACRVQELKAAARRYGVRVGLIGAADRWHACRHVRACNRPWRSSYINAEGKLVACASALTREAYAVADLLQPGARMPDAYNAAPMQAFRRACLCGELPEICGGCGYAR